MRVALDRKRFGPWALVTGASSGIGKEFARQIAASGIHVALVGRREPLLRNVGAECTRASGVQHRVIPLDLSEPDFLPALVDATRDLDIAHHFGQQLGERRRGGIILAGAMGAENGVPIMANDGAAKAYVHSLGEALHYEFKPLGVYVTVLAAGFTDTAVIEKFGLDPKTMPLKPMSVDQCVSEGLSGLSKNRSRIVPGRLNRIMNALVPASLARKMLADLLGKGIASKAAPANARAGA